MHSVVEGGFFLYSTCSYSKEENEENLDQIMESGLFESVSVDVPDEWTTMEIKLDGEDIYKEIKCEMFICPYRTNDKNKLYDGKW